MPNVMAKPECGDIVCVTASGNEGKKEKAREELLYDKKALLKKITDFYK